MGELAQALDRAGVEHFEVESESALSKYYDGTSGPSLYILDESSGRLTPVARYTPLYQRYAGAVRLSRAYVRPEQLQAARTALAEQALGT